MSESERPGDDYHEAIQKAVFRDDLSQDIAEKHNLAADRPDVVARMKKILSQEPTDEAQWPLKDAQGAMPF